MTKKILSVLLAVLLAVSCMTFATTAEENVFYVEEGATGNGSEMRPFGTINEAIEALNDKDGTIYIIGGYYIGKDQHFNDMVWDGMITFVGYDKNSCITMDESFEIRLYGDATFKNMNFDLGRYSHLNPVGSKLIMDAGRNSEFSEMMHLTSYKDEIVDEAYAEFKSGIVNTLYAAGGYASSYASGCEGNSTIIIDGATVNQFHIAADRYLPEGQTGITIGGNLNILFNSGSVGKIVYDELTIPEIFGALNIVFNNQIVPEYFVYPANCAAEGVYVVRSEKGGMITPTDEPGKFIVKADKGRVAEIAGEKVYDGIVELAPGEHYVKWTIGKQIVTSKEIKLVIGKSEIVTNGVATAIDVPAQIINDRTYVPVRAIFEALGATVDWDDSTKTVLSSMNGKTVNLPVGKAVVIVDGVEQAAVAEALIVDSRTLVPARVAAEAYGCDVQWDDTTKTVTITTK